MPYNMGMSPRHERGGSGHVAAIPNETMELIRDAANEYRVSQWVIVDEAVGYFLDELDAGRIAVPDGWRQRVFTSSHA